jgi:glycosyltransferase involved in cell wall biosynthesis
MDVNKTIKLVFLLDSLGMGGSEKSALILLELLKKYTDIDILCIVLAKNDSRISNKKYTISKGINVYYLYKDNYTSLKKLLYTPYSVYKLRNLLKNSGITHIVSFHDYSNLLNILLKKIFNYQAITSERRYSKHYFGNRNRYMQYFLKFVFNNSDVVIVNDIDIERSLRKDYQITSKIEVLNNLVKSSFVDNFQKNSSKSQLTFITIGRLTDEKNTKDILYAFSRLKYKNIKLQIIGDGPNRNILENLSIELKIKEQVEFIGQTNDIYKYLRSADVFVFTSLTEGFPNVILEAMLSGLPIISYQFKAGITSILDNGKYGFLVTNGNIKKFADTMEKFINDQELIKKYSLLSLNRIRKYTDEKKYISDFLSIIKGES